MMLQRFLLITTIIVCLCVSGSILAQDSPVNPAEEAKRIANLITGLNGLSNVQITTNEETVRSADDTTPISLFKERIIDRSLWKVSYRVETLQYNNKMNPHIRGFDVYVNGVKGQVLKIASHNAPEMPSKYRTGIVTSNKQVALILRDNAYFIDSRVPTVAPTIKFVDLIGNKGTQVRQFEAYYFLQHDRENNTTAPAWLVVFYGTAPIRALGATANQQYHTLAEKYQRTFEMWVYDATTGALGFGAQIVGTNDDTFD